VSTRLAQGTTSVRLARKVISAELCPFDLTWKNGPPPEEVAEWQRIDGIRVPGLLTWVPSLAQSGYVVWVGPQRSRPSSPYTSADLVRVLAQIEGQAIMHHPFPLVSVLNMTQSEGKPDVWTRRLRLSISKENCLAFKKLHGQTLADHLSFLLRDGKYPAAWLIAGPFLLFYIKIMAESVPPVHMPHTPHAVPSPA
jgi:hypothetical protein